MRSENATFVLCSPAKLCQRVPKSVSFEAAAINQLETRTTKKPEVRFIFATSELFCDKICSNTQHICVNQSQFFLLAVVRPRVLAAVPANDGGSLF